MLVFWEFLYNQRTHFPQERNLIVWKHQIWLLWRNLKRSQQVPFHWPCCICCIPVPRPHFHCPVDDINGTCTKVVLELHIWSTLQSQSLWSTKPYMNVCEHMWRSRQIHGRWWRRVWHKGWLFQLEVCGCTVHLVLPLLLSNYATP